MFSFDLPVLWSKEGYILRRMTQVFSCLICVSSDWSLFISVVKALDQAFRDPKQITVAEGLGNVSVLFSILLILILKDDHAFCYCAS